MAYDDDMLAFSSEDSIIIVCLLSSPPTPRDITLISYLEILRNGDVQHRLNTYMYACFLAHVKN